MTCILPQDYVNKFKNVLEENPDFSIGLAVIRILADVITNSTSTTFMGVDTEMMRVTSAIHEAIPNLPLHFQGAAKVFRAILSKTSESSPENWKTLFAANSAHQISDAEEALQLIPKASRKFIQHGMTIMTIGYDPLVADSLIEAAKIGRRFHVVVAAGSPKNDGVKCANILSSGSPNLTVTLISDISVGLWMKDIDTVMLGTDVVLEDGSLLAAAGTYTLAALASIHRKPVYCICESFKFMRGYILNSDDLAKVQRKADIKPTGVDSKVECYAAEFDHTPSNFVSLLITEKGPMPPTAVTHELTKLLGIS